MSEIVTDSDRQLLMRYRRDHAEDAFAEIVRRHLGLVHSAALRQVRSPQLAEEVAQSVFADLARSVNQLKPDTMLTAWLYQVTRRTAIDVVRRETRRQLREQIATELNAMNATTADWAHIEPLLDDAMSALDEIDRTAVLLRYFENKSLREVGATLGTSDDAAQKRVSRAVERLREFFAKCGITVGASGLVVVISTNAVQAAPIGLAIAISTATALTGTALATTATVTATKAIAMTALQKTIVTATIAVLAGAGIYEARQASQLRDQVQTLQQLQAPLNEQIQRLQEEYDQSLKLITGLKEDVAKNEKNNLELLRLRGELARFRTMADIRGTNSAIPAQNDQAISEQQKQIRELMKKANRYYVVEGRLFVLKRHLQLTFEQEGLVRRILEQKVDDSPNWWSKTPDPDITAILTSEQKLAAEQWSEEEWRNTRNGAVKTGAESDLHGLRFWLDLDQSQLTSILPILEDHQTKMYQLEDAKRDTRYSKSFWPVEEELRRKKLDGLKSILSPEQFDIVRSVEEAQIEAGRLINRDRP